jgi:hypothetical protein
MFKTIQFRSFWVFFTLLSSFSINSKANADDFLDISCLRDYKSLLKSVESLEVSAFPNPIKIPMTGVKSYFGELPANCKGQFPAGATLKIFSLNNQLYSFDLTAKTSKPYFSRFLGIKEISRMEAAFRRNNYANAEFSTNIDGNLRFNYQVELVLNGFVENLTYRSPESSKYE